MNENKVDESSQNIVVLEFGHVHSSPDYSRAVELAKNMSTYSEAGRGSQLRHRVALTDDESKKWIELYGIVQNWKSSRVYYKELNNSAKGSLGTFYCYLERCKASDKDSHCFDGNWIGCQKTTEGRSLLLDRHVGKFIDRNTFQPDKEAIKHKVTEGLDRYGLCPAFNPSRIFEQIERLPSEINLKDNSVWKPFIERDFITGTPRMEGVSFHSDVTVPESPIAEDVDASGDFGPYAEWEHKIIIFSNNEWREGGRTGNMLQITELGRMGWQLVTVIHHEGEWYCILQRQI